ncbi:P-loop containing nucleoside triphosphate hydrolase protein [Tribonema minus]|uniref:P-loop containing nucleoside triphosphate hydrolase protein n=1 Tax=Tribonema minus TaxID=303371 RepID=A0A835ZC17_9STRA|nr:P-loop containing nucleoside triphosphate hydrolase protein [Tribonema minus]
MIALVISSGTNMAFPTIMGKVIDRTAGREDAGSRIPDKVFFAGAFGIFACGSIASWVRTYSIGVAAHRIMQRLRTKLFGRLLEQDVAFFDEHRTGELVSILTEDTEIAADTVTGKAANGMRSASSALNGSIMLLTLSPRLTLVSIALLPLVGVGAMGYSRRLKRLAARQREDAADASTFAEERLSQLRTVRAFGRERAEAQWYRELCDGSTELARRAASARGAFMGGLSASANASLVAVLYFGGSLVARGAMTVGDLASFAMYSSLVGLGFSGLSSFAADLSKGLASAERVFMLMDATPAVPLDEGLTPPLESVRGELVLEGVTFRYPSRDKDVLCGVDLRVPAGAILALTGPSGHGKSTLAALITRLYQPTAGRISLDGVDTATLSPSWLRGAVGVVEQDPVLFAGSVADNIKYGRPGASAADVEAAARAANAHQFILEFPDGYNTKVGQRGRQLSGGQRQRVAIARALLWDPPLLLLDEATSALDAESERLVRDAMEKLMDRENRTLLIIAHRQSTIQKAHTVAVLRDGRIVESGSYADLIARSGGELAALMSGGELAA